MCLILFISISCNKQQENNVNRDDIVKITYVSNKVIYDITKNTYTLDKRFMEPGVHNLMLTSLDLASIKDKIVEQKIYNLKDSLKFVKSCPEICLSELLIDYKSGRKQHFIFDNSNYKDNFSNESYLKIISLEELIGDIIRKKKIDPETKNVYL
ncbi:hypothetical protein BAY06_07930 [Elizabethkingia anophelis]|nr:hypothetical protein BAY06_07930 [Elizabethkingia anophelis]